MTNTLRSRFLEYFKNQGHSIVASSATVPFNDPTLLFTNAGMNQFKDVFLAETGRDYTRAASSQKCIRVGGKHNDLDNVGHTRRHLTFFEMLGNFSFGDYFKEDAIRFAWEVATKVFDMDPERIWPTVFRTDDEAFDLWLNYVPSDRITRFDEKDNFWSMGETGPCGPCSELLYDRGEKYGSAKKPSEDVSGERFLEFWNLVFMQYNRDDKGNLHPLPKPSIDTGAGLERIVSLKMEVDSVFETDVLRSLIARVEEVLGIPYQEESEKAPAFRVIADHLRCLAFAIADGVQPSNTDRGYVLRKVLRRATRYGRTLGAEKPFLAEILPALSHSMGHAYPEIVTGQGRIAEILTQEEENFLRTLRRGGNLLNQILEGSKQAGHIAGDDAFKLKDTYGLPLEEIQLIARDSNLKIDFSRFKELEEEARAKSRKVHKITKQSAQDNIYQYLPETRFVGYQTLDSESHIVALLHNGQLVDKLEAGQEGGVILDITPFYAEMGGQVGDTGFLKNHGFFTIQDTKSPYKGVIVHFGRVKEGFFKVEDAVQAHVDKVRRAQIESHHTATHLLHWALHQVLGEHIKQAGSVVDAERLRFDFSHHKPLSAQEIIQIEDLINAKIRENTPVRWYELAYEEASKRHDIKQFFGEKYGSFVRVIDINYSKELCGGTHISDLGKIGLFRIAKEGSIAAGVRRVEAVTGEAAEQMMRSAENMLEEIATLLKVPSEKLKMRVEKLLEENRELSQALKIYKSKELDLMAKALLTQVETLGGIKALFAKVELEAEDFKDVSDLLSSQMQPGVVVLANTLADRASLLVRISDEIANGNLDAGRWIKILAPIIEGSGGGKANSAQAGGKALHKVDEALIKARSLLT